MFFFCFKQKTAYDMRMSDWSSDVCSSDLNDVAGLQLKQLGDRDVRTRQHAARLQPDVRQRRAHPLTPVTAGDAAVVMQVGGQLDLDGAKRGDRVENVDRCRHALQRRRNGKTGDRDRKSTRLNSSHSCASRMPSSA